MSCVYQSHGQNSLFHWHSNLKHLYLMQFCYSTQFHRMKILFSQNSNRASTVLKFNKRRWSIGQKKNTKFDHINAKILSRSRFFFNYLMYVSLRFEIGHKDHKRQKWIQSKTFCADEKTYIHMNKLIVYKQCETMKSFYHQCI